MGLSLRLEKRNGVHEWIFQRISNIAIIVWATVYLLRIFLQDDITYDVWLALHTPIWFKCYSALTLTVAMLNAILAGWQIGTDYTQKVPIPGFAGFYYAFYITLTSVCWLAGMYIISM